MKSLRKRKCISQDITFLKNKKPLKKIKLNGLEYESRSSIDWHEVKIILDATVVEKYLQNKKSISDLLKTNPTSNKLIPRCEINSVPCVTEVNKTNGNVFSQRKNVMVKIEIPEDIQFDSSAKINFEFVDVAIKQEDIDIFRNDSINNDNFVEFLNIDCQGQENDKNEDRTSVTAKEIVAPFKNEINESHILCEEVTIDSEFKQEGTTSQNYQTRELIHQNNNNVVNKEISAPAIRRSSRKRKICHNWDDYEHEVLKRPRIPSNVKKKHTVEVSDKDSNCSSKPRTSSRSNQHKTLATTQPANAAIKLLYCDYCNYQISRKRYLITHIHKRHLSLFADCLSCPYCRINFQNTKNLEKHKQHCAHFLNCIFCSVTVSSKSAMKEHLIKMHNDEFHGRRTQTFVNEIRCDAAKDRKTPFIKLYCNSCNKSYEKYCGRRTKHCPNCNTKLLYQCQKCELTQPNYRLIWKHLRSKGISCDISKNLSFTVNEERLKNKQNRNDQRIYNCKMCEYKGTTKCKLYEHIALKHNNLSRKNQLPDGSSICFKCGITFDVPKWSFKKHVETCSTRYRYPCKFCLMSCFDTKQLNHHLSSVHFDKLDGINVENIIDEVKNFRRMIRDNNVVKINKRYPANEETSKMIADGIKNSNDYVTGVDSILKSICLECSVSFLQSREKCNQCQNILTFQCLRCDERIENYSAGWEHITQTCKNRIRALTIEKLNKDSVKHNASLPKDIGNSFHCDFCGFKNSSKLVLSRHITHEHRESTIDGRYTCWKCHMNFKYNDDLIYHKLRCRPIYNYSCHICPYSATSSANIKKHLIYSHSHYFGNHDNFTKSLNETLMKIVENRTIQSKSYTRCSRTGRPVRTFSENIELVICHCPNCDENFQGRNFRAKDVKYCQKCQNRVMLICRICDKAYSTWNSMANHLGKGKCPDVKQQVPDLPSYQLDHTYASKDHPDHSYANKFPPLDLENL